MKITIEIQLEAVDSPTYTARINHALAHLALVGHEREILGEHVTFLQDSPWRTGAMSTTRIRVSKED